MSISVTGKTIQADRAAIIKDMQSPRRNGNARPAAKQVAAKPKKADLPKRHRARHIDDFKTSTLNVRVKSEVKEDATRVLKGIGISLPEAVRVFLGRIARDQSLPFQLEVPNAETAEALRASIGSNSRQYTSTKDMFDDLESSGDT